VADGAREHDDVTTTTMTASTTRSDEPTGDEQSPSARHNRVRVGQADGGGEMFNRIARRYDLLNRLMSLGMDGRWRRAVVRSLRDLAPRRLLDVATGTGDLAFDLARRFPDAHVIGIDPADRMLGVARDKAGARRLADRVEFRTGDAQALDLPTDGVDAATIAFGIRNVPDRARGLAEMARVTRPGGIVAVLELTDPRRGLLAPLNRFYIRTIVPRLGALLSGDQEYRYLPASIAAFPQPPEFAAMMRDAGLVDVTIRPLTFGVVTRFVGRVPG
jgi:demethylmenaquinone methyltransferase/2-methoxy-6-polyprenyl-1,4-benzoquinol methylase